jgi:hypothetical protein
VRKHDLIRLRKKIQEAIDKQAEWGQFEVWWHNMNRTLTIVAPKEVHEKDTSFQKTSATYRHNDDFLIALLRDAQERRDYAMKQKIRNVAPSEYYFYVEDLSGMNVDVAWRKLCLFFYLDRDREKWSQNDWQPTDRNGPHRP